jgi:hypothetical protein
MNQQLDFLTTVNAPLSVGWLLANLMIGLLLAILLRWHFIRFGSTLANRRAFSVVFPFIVLTTVLIISIVKSSLALSLGLVGALSIVRFRTPIKEPEELAYLFIAIAMGLGLGAAQTIPTVAASLFILVTIPLVQRSRSVSERENIFLSIDWDHRNGSRVEEPVKALSELVRANSRSADLRRMDLRPEGLEATFLLEVANPEELHGLIERLSQEFPGIGVTFLEQRQMPSL